MSDQVRDERGRFATSGSAGNQPVKSSAGQPSVHTRLSRVANEKIAIGKRIDETHFPVRSENEQTAMADHAQPLGPYLRVR